MKNKWNKIFNTLTAADQELRSYIASCGNAVKMKAFVKLWESLKTDANDIDAVMSVDAVTVNTPFKDASVSETWSTWKSYLLEQHGIVMGSLTRPVSCFQIWQLPLQGHLPPVCQDNGKEKQTISSAKTVLSV